jgi:hypothetical protein
MTMVSLLWDLIYTWFFMRTPRILMPTTTVIIMTMKRTTKMGMSRVCQLCDLIEIWGFDEDINTQCCAMI